MGHNLIVTLVGVVMFTLSSIQPQSVMGYQARESQPVEIAIGLEGVRSTFPEAIATLNEFGTQTVIETDQPAVYSMSQLRDGIASAIEAVQSIDIRYEYQLERQFVTTAQSLSEEAGKLVPPGFSLSVHVALDGFRQYADVEEVTDGKPLQHTVSVFDGEATKSFQPNSLFGGVSAVRDENAVTQVRDYTDPLSLPVCMHEGADEFRESPLFIPYLLSFEDFYSVKPTLDEVDGHLCHVVSMDSDTIWIDTDNGFLLRRRLMFDLPTESEPHCVNYLMVAQDEFEVDPGVFMPLSLWQHEFGSHSEPVHLRGKLANTRHIAVESIKIRGIDENLFNFEFPPGTRITDLIRNAVYFMPDGVELIDKAVAEGGRIINGEVVGADHILIEQGQAIGARRLSVHWLWWINVALLSLLGMGYLFHRRKSASRDR